MRLSPVLAALIGIGAALPAGAQTDQTGQSRYTTTAPSGLDKNFGLPTFGMPGSELPQQKTMAPVRRTPDQPDFFKGSIDQTTPDGPSRDVPDFFTGTGDMALPKARPSDQTTAETPLFTTREGDEKDTTTGDMTTGRIGTSDSDDSSKSDDRP